MPALNKDQRFVVGLSGFGWLDTAYQKFGPFGMGQSTLNAARIKYLKEQGRFLLRITPTYAFRDGVFVQGQVEGRPLTEDEPSWGLAPTFYLDLGFQPSAGAYLWLDDALAPGNAVRSQRQRGAGRTPRNAMPRPVSHGPRAWR